MNKSESGGQDKKTLEVKRLFESFLDDNQFDASELKKALKTDNVKKSSKEFLLAVLIGITHSVYGEIRKADSNLLDVENILFLGE